MMLNHQPLINILISILLLVCNYGRLHECECNAGYKKKLLLVNKVIPVSF